MAVFVTSRVDMGASWAQSQTCPPIVDRHFDIDLFEQPALGSPRLIAMAGAVSSVAEGAVGVYTNPASASVRPETDADELAWNVYVNSYVPVEEASMLHEIQGRAPRPSVRSALQIEREGCP